MTKIKNAKISDLIPDDKNANKGTEYGKHLMDKSFRQFGAGRSILLDKNNKIIAGNKSTEQCAEIGIEDVIIVESDGTKLIAVKRTDIDIDTKQGRELALADNATQKADLEWDNDIVNALASTFEIDVEDWGIKKEEIFNGNIDDFFEESNSEKKRKELICPYCGENINKFYQQ